MELLSQAARVGKPIVERQEARLTGIGPFFVQRDVDLVNGLGIHWFDGHPLVSYAIPLMMPQWMTGSHSFRLTVNFGAGPEQGLRPRLRALFRIVLARTGCESLASKWRK